MIEENNKMNGDIGFQDDGSQEGGLMYRFGIVSRVVVGALIVLTLYLISRDDYLLYHIIVEIFSVVISFGIFLIIWNSYRHLENHFFLILALGIGCSAVFDFLHIISYKGMGILEFGQHDPSNLATQLWLIARFIQAGTYLGAIFFFRKTSRWKWFFLYFIISTLFLVSLFVLRIFPIAYSDGHLTLFKRVSEYVISSMFLLAVYLFYRKKDEFDKSVYRLLVVSLIVTIFSELFFTLYSDVYGLFNFVGHIFMVLAFYFLYRAIIVTAIERPHDFLFHRLLIDENKLKQNEKELQRRNSLLKKENSEVEALLSSIGDGVVAMDRNGRIRYSNPAFNKMVSCPPIALHGKIISDVVPFFDEKDRLVPNSARPLWVAISKGKFSVVKRTNFYFINSSGRRINLSITAAPVVTRGKITGGIAVFRDITKEKEVERTRAEYISFAAHQLRTPLSTIRLTMEVLLFELSKKKPGDVTQYLDDIVDETDIMTKTVDHFLDVTKIEAGLYTIAPKPSRIAQLLNDQIRLLGPQLEKNNIKIRTDFEPSLPAVPVDPRVLEMICDNLLSNAIKYTRKGGLVKIALKKKNHSFIISVEDDGFGIPKADQSKVFKKMFRASNITKSEGTGLGLYIVRLLIEQSGGKIDFNSSDKGTVFYVTYPLSGMKGKQIKSSS